MAEAIEAVEQSSQLQVWLKHPKTGNTVLVAHEDTRQRCLLEGWVIVADPTLPAPEPMPTPAPETQETAAAAPAGEVGEVGEAQAVSPTADDTFIADSPEALAAIEEAQAKAFAERNNAARTAFGVASPPSPATQAKAPRGKKV